MVAGKIQKIQKIQKYILYHGSCPDGFAAAWCAWKLFKDEAIYIPCRYGDPQPNIPQGSKVFILDFSYSRKTIEQMASEYDLVVLDHHKSVEAELKDLPYVKFDLDKSGAMLAWEYFHPDKPVPDFIKYIQDWDLWKFSLPNSNEISAAIQSYPYVFEIWNTFSDPKVFALLSLEGITVLRTNKQIIDATCSQAKIVDFYGYSVPMVNSTCLWSYVGIRLLELYPEAKFSVVWYEDNRGYKVFSLRSRDDFDCSKIAVQFGGGGHPKSAGMRLAKAG